MTATATATEATCKAIPAYLIPQTATPGRRDCSCCHEDEAPQLDQVLVKLGTAHLQPWRPVGRQGCSLFDRHPPVIAQLLAETTAPAARAVTRLAFAASVPVRARSIATDRKMSASVRAFTVMWLVSPQCASCAPKTWVAP